VWTPDGSGVLFLSNRGGSIDGWVISVANGVASADITRVAKGLERVTPLGLTSSGTLYYAYERESPEVFTVSVGERGGAPSQPIAVPRGWGTTHRGPAWSPDGRTLAYFATSGMGELTGEAVVTLLDVARDEHGISCRRCHSSLAAIHRGGPPTAANC
jgi:Tol biopolymer transport system component